MAVTALAPFETVAVGSGVSAYPEGCTYRELCGRCAGGSVALVLAVTAAVSGVVATDAFDSEMVIPASADVLSSLAVATGAGGDDTVAAETDCGVALSAADAVAVDCVASSVDVDVVATVTGCDAPTVAAGVSTVPPDTPTVEVLGASLAGFELEVTAVAVDCCGSDDRTKQRLVSAKQLYVLLLTMRYSSSATRCLISACAEGICKQLST